MFQNGLDKKDAIFVIVPLYISSQTHTQKKNTDSPDMESIALI